MSTPSIPPNSSSAPLQPTDPQTVAMIGRQPIVNASHQVVAYELFDRSGSHTAASDATLVINALSHAGEELLSQKRLIFVNCTHNSLAGGHLDLLNPERVVLEIPPLEQPDTQSIEHRFQILAQLRRRGFRLAFGQFVLEATYALWRPLASFVKMDVSQIAPADLREVIRAVRKTTDAALIAEKIETAEQYDRVSSLGVQMFQGYWFAKPTVVQTRLVSPVHANIIQLINLIRNQASTDEIEEVLKKDAGLAFNLMRLINSAGFGFTKQVTSFRQAIMLLGLKKLFRWAALLLTATQSTNGPSTIGQLAVVRGRLMELLASASLPQEESDNAFICGIFSLLDIMLGLSMEKALDLITLPTAVTQTLLEQGGPYEQLLKLANACETGDDATFSAACRQLGITSQQANWAHLQALAWADQISDD